MITEIRLCSNSAASTAAFWSAIFNTPAENLGDGRWRVTPSGGPFITVTTARAIEAITSVDLTVTVDNGAADRLRHAGFDVAHDGSQAVDVNGCDNTVHLRPRGWDGTSAVVRDDTYYEQFSRAVEQGDYRVVGPVEIRGEERER